MIYKSLNNCHEAILTSHELIFTGKASALEHSIIFACFCAVVIVLLSPLGEDKLHSCSMREAIWPDIYVCYVASHRSTAAVCL